jgi:hypothetical protein
MDSGLLYDTATVAAKTRHFEELFAIWVFALWTHNCTYGTRSSYGTSPQRRVILEPEGVRFEGYRLYWFYKLPQHCKFKVRVNLLPK